MSMISFEVTVKLVELNMLMYKEAVSYTHLTLPTILRV